MKQFWLLSNRQEGRFARPGPAMMRRAIFLATPVLAAAQLFAQQGTPNMNGGRGGPAPGQSPASRRPPATTNPQSYTGTEIQAGQVRFISQCGSCHGRDAQGGESGPDLTRSTLVAQDLRGDKIGPLILSGRHDKEMPAFSLPAVEIASIVAFIHDAHSKAESKAESELGGRRSVDVSDLQTGSAEAGKLFFNGKGGCAQCHGLSGAFATVASRFQGLALLQRMLYPGRGGRGAPVRPAAIVTAANGQKPSGRVAYRDEFTITLIDSEGWSHSFPAGAVKIEIDDPLRAHTDLLGRYTDEEIHDVFAYLQTLK
jgi:cytochrome c oxidase cbb3-type subunit III